MPSQRIPVQLCWQLSFKAHGLIDAIKRRVQLFLLTYLLKSNTINVLARLKPISIKSDGESTTTWPDYSMTYWSQCDAPRVHQLKLMTGPQPPVSEARLYWWNSIAFHNSIRYRSLNRTVSDNSATVRNQKRLQSVTQHLTIHYTGWKKSTLLTRRIWNVYNHTIIHRN